MKNKCNSAILLLAISFIVSCQGQKANKENEQSKDIEGFVENPTAYVDPFLGTAHLIDSKLIGYVPPKDWRVWAGLVFPSSCSPNAMVQQSPSNRISYWRWL